MSIKDNFKENIRILKDGKKYVDPLVNANGIKAIIFGACSMFYEFFHENATLITRENWEQGKYPDMFKKDRGWIYTFYLNDRVAIYVGETKQTLRERFYDHKNREWWNDWQYISALPCNSQSDRKLLEAMLGASEMFLKNKLQPPTSEDVLNSTIKRLVDYNNRINYCSEGVDDMLEYINSELEESKS